METPDITCHLDKSAISTAFAAAGYPDDAALHIELIQDAVKGAWETLIHRGRLDRTQFMFYVKDLVHSTNEYWRSVDILSKSYLDRLERNKDRDLDNLITYSTSI